MKKLSALILGLITMVTLTGCSPDSREGTFYETFVKPMDQLLKAIYDIVGSWGLAIVVATIILRLIVMPFMIYNVKKQRDAKIGMEKARPELSVITEKVNELKKEEVRAISKEDKIRIRQQQMELQREQMAVMRKYNANPMSLVGCLPILIQAPFLTGFYFTLVNPLYSAGIKTSTFLGFFPLGERSYILPIFAFIVYFIQTKLQLVLNPQTPQPGQEAMMEQMKMMQWITPIMIGGFSFVVPGGAAVYYIVGGLFLIAQTYIGYLIYPPYKPEVVKEPTFDPNKAQIVAKNKKKKK